MVAKGNAVIAATHKDRIDARKRKAETMFYIWFIPLLILLVLLLWAMFGALRRRNPSRRKEGRTLHHEP